MYPLPDRDQPRGYQKDHHPIDLLAPLLACPPDLSALPDEVAWARIKEHAGSYGVAALVAYAARSHVSPGERAWCDRVLVDCWARHERMLAHLDYLLSLFAADGIQTIVLKGPLLGRKYYTPPFLRKPSMDLDLAVVERDLEGACNVLVKAGYTLDVPINKARSVSHHVALTHPSKARVELHFRLSHQTLGIPVDQFFPRAVSCHLPGGREARILGPADQLLHLVLHLAHARFGTLFHLYEVRLVCSLEPPGVRAEAIQRAIDHHFCGVLRMVDIAFRTRWGEPFLPPETAVPATWFSWRLNEKLYRRFELWSMPGRELTLAARLWGRWLDFQLTDGPSDAIRAIKLLMRSARFGIAGRAWGKIANLTYGPNYSAR